MEVEKASKWEVFKINGFLRHICFTTLIYFKLTIFVDCYHVYGFLIFFFFCWLGCYVNGIIPVILSGGIFSPYLMSKTPRYASRQMTSAKGLLLPLSLLRIFFIISCHLIFHSPAAFFHFPVSPPLSSRCMC